MLAKVTISVSELACILRESLRAKLGVEVEAVVITSYDKPRIEINMDDNGEGMIEALAFKHRYKKES